MPEIMQRYNPGFLPGLRRIIRIRGSYRRDLEERRIGDCRPRSVLLAASLRKPWEELDEFFKGSQQLGQPKESESDGVDWTSLVRVNLGWRETTIATIVVAQMLKETPIVLP